MTDQLSGPAAREQLLASIDLPNVHKHHELIRDIFRAEMEHRRRTGGDDYFENLYWSAYLIYLIGDPSDTPMMWEAKHIDFDTGCGLDIQFMLGAGLPATLAYLTDHGYLDVARQLGL